MPGVDPETLAALTGASVTADDSFLVYDLSAHTFKRIVPAEAKIGLNVKPPTRQVLTVGSGTYTRPAGCNAIFVQVQAGGAGGGGGDGA